MLEPYRHLRRSLFTPPSAWVIACVPIRQLFLCLWLGGLIIIGAVVAPVTFHLLRNAPELATNAVLQTDLAGDIVGGSLSILNVISYVAGPVLFVSDMLLSMANPAGYSPSNCLKPFLIGTAWLIALLLGLALFPIMSAARQQGAAQAFDRMHHTYEIFSYVQMMLLLAYIALGAAETAYELRNPIVGRD